MIECWIRSRRAFVAVTGSTPRNEANVPKKAYMALFVFPLSISLRVKIGAKVVRHGRYVTFQLAEVAIPWRLFAEILRLIAVLRPKPAPT